MASPAMFSIPCYKMGKEMSIKGYSQSYYYTIGMVPDSPRLLVF